MRLDKLLSDAALMPRSDATKAIRSGRVTVDGAVKKSPSIHADPTVNTIALDGKPLTWQRFTYIMLNKPSGYVSTTDISDSRCVLHLLPPEYRRAELFPCGRLDIDTLGLLLLTSDGKTAHELLAPKHHVKKIYRFTCDIPLDGSAISALEGGVDIGEDKPTRPAMLSADDDMRGGTITIVEGKFHQIKRMFEAIGRKITSLERLSFGPLSLDPKLERGAWRKLTEDEISLLLSAKERANEDSNFFK